MTLTPPFHFGAPRSLEHVGGAPSVVAEAAERIEQLRGALRAVRGIHLLVARERDPARLIERAAALLVEARGFLACCIAVGAPGRVALRAQAGALAQSAPLRRMLDAGTLPACLCGPMSEGSPFVRHGRSPDCDRCPIEQEWNELRDTVGVPLLVDGQILGGLVVALPPGMASDPDEVALIQEVAESLAHGLASLERERALRESEALFRTIFEQAAVGVAQVDLRTERIVRANQVYASMLGYTREEMQGRSWRDFTPPDTLAENDAALALLAERPSEPVTFEKCYLHRDGSTVWVKLSASLMLGPDGAPAYRVAVAQDISAHRRATDALRASEERYRSLIENLSEVVFTTDVEGRLTFVSTAIDRFGFTPEEMVGRSIAVWIHPDDLGMLQGARERAFRGDSEPVEFRMFDKGGRVRFVRTSRRAVYDGEHLVGLFGVLTDLTEQREVEEQLRAAQKMEAVGRLAGGVAHDFNNLLTVISSYTAFVADGLPEADPLLANLAEVSKASLRAQALTRQLLAFSRKQVLQPQVLDFNALVGGVEAMLRRLIGEDIRLIFAPAPGLGLVKVDPGQIDQVLMNLAVNARDAMPRGGTLTIATSNEQIDEAHVKAHPGAIAGPCVKLSVTDTGMGMDELTASRIFEPFFTTKGLGKGTGLGLSTVYGIVKQSGGGIRVESEPGRGTRFEIYLPRELEREKSLHPEGSKETQVRSGDETILVVEDEPGVRDLACRLLVSAGYRVISAAGGEEALHLWERHGSEVDLLLADVVMPGMDGRELADRLLALRPGLRVLFMSGYTDDAIAEHGVLEPGRHFIDKPFDRGDLTTKVRRVLDLR